MNIEIPWKGRWYLLPREACGQTIVVLPTGEVLETKSWRIRAGGSAEAIGLTLKGTCAGSEYFLEHYADVIGGVFARAKKDSPEIFEIEVTSGVQAFQCVRHFYAARGRLTGVFLVAIRGITKDKKWSLDVRVGRKRYLFEVSMFSEVEMLV